MQVSQENHTQSIPKYLNYVLMRIKNRMIISEDEMQNTYQYYKDFCIEQGIDYLSRPRFYTELNERGLETKKAWNSHLQKTTTVRDLNNKDLVVLALHKWVDNSAVHGAIMEIDGVKYQITVKLVKILNI